MRLSTAEMAISPPWQPLSGLSVIVRPSILTIRLTDSLDGFLGRGTYLLMDRDGKYCPSFRGILEQAGVKQVQLPAKSPNLNAHMERFLRSLKEECLDGLIPFGERSLRTAVSEFLNHYHLERNHQGLQNQIIDLQDEVGRAVKEICCRQRLGGMLRYYYRRAA